MDPGGSDLSLLNFVASFLLSCSKYDESVTFLLLRWKSSKGPKGAPSLKLPTMTTTTTKTSTTTTMTSTTTTMIEMTAIKSARMAMTTSGMTTETSTLTKTVTTTQLRPRPRQWQRWWLLRRSWWQQPQSRDFETFVMTRKLFWLFSETETRRCHNFWPK